VPSSVKEIVLRDIDEVMHYFLSAGRGTEHFYRRAEDRIADGIVGCYAATMYAVRSAASSLAIETCHVVTDYAMCLSPFVISCSDRSVFFAHEAASVRPTCDK
jgi:hypothetical protein